MGLSLIRLPGELKHHIEQAHELGLSGPTYALPPFYRAAIYRAVDLAEPGRARDVRGWLAVISAESVLPVWQQQWPDRTLPERLLETAKAALHGRIAKAEAQSLAGHAFGELDNLAQSPEAIGHSQAYYAGEAAFQALLEALGERPFDHLNIDKHTSNQDLDEGTTDTVWYASVAYAGREMWEPFAALEKGPSPSSEKRKQFWEWWLFTAIPQAWQIVEDSLDEDADEER